MNNKQKRYMKVKRVNSILCSLVWIPLSFPFFVLVFLINLVYTKGHPFFKQERVGYQGEIFTIYKFQTMKEDDEHISLWGRFLRFTSLDELPQFINILLGKMTFIGPRPLSIKDKDMNELRKNSNPSPFSVRPGLTGYGQINFHKAYSNEEKVNNDIYYVEHFSLLLDLKILLITIFKLVPITIHNK